MIQRAELSGKSLKYAFRVVFGCVDIRKFALSENSAIVEDSVLASHQIGYAIYSNTLTLQNPTEVKSWISANAQALLNVGAKGVAISANLPILAAPNAPSVAVKTTISMEGISFAMARRNYIPGATPHNPTSPGVITVIK